MFQFLFTKIENPAIGGMKSCFCEVNLLSRYCVAQLTTQWTIMECPKDHLTRGKDPKLYPPLYKAMEDERTKQNKVQQNKKYLAQAGCFLFT